MSEQPDPRTHLGRTASEIKRLMTGPPPICPVCRLMAESLRQHVDFLFYERVTDPATREAIREAGGFYRFKDEARGAESDSWRRALNMTSGWLDE